MRIEANLTAELDGKPLKIRWKNRKLAKDITEASNKFLAGVEKIDAKEKEKNSDADQIEQERQDLLAEYYRDKCDVMFEFKGGTPPVEWFARDDFPVGQMEFLMQVFTNPQIQT